MSGEPVVLVAETGSVAYRAVHRLAELAPHLPRFALIGGLAVIARLGRAHRATNDVDAVSDDEAGLLDALLNDGLMRRGDGVMLDVDLSLDVIDVGEGDPDYLPYATHRLAFETCTPVDLIVRPDGTGLSTSATVDVARASALVAIKLAISEDVGRPRDAHKVGSDAFDLARLLQRFGPDALADELKAIAETRLVERVAELAERHLVDQVDRTVAGIVRSAVLGVERIEPEQLELLGSAFTRRLFSS